MISRLGSVANFQEIFCENIESRIYKLILTVLVEFYYHVVSGLLFCDNLKFLENFDMSRVLEKINTRIFKTKQPREKKSIPR